MRGVHYVLHAPQGDTYADLLFTMIERNKKRPPVTYTTFQARDLGARHGGTVQGRWLPPASGSSPGAAGRRILHSRTDPGRARRPGQARLASNSGSAGGMPAYQRKENWGAAETFYQLVRPAAARTPPPETPAAEHGRVQAATCSARLARVPPPR
jgi:light-independent protochlorophyllide reductase subunit B